MQTKIELLPPFGVACGANESDGNLQTFPITCQENKKGDGVDYLIRLQLDKIEEQARKIEKLENKLENVSQTICTQERTINALSDILREEKAKREQAERKAASSKETSSLLTLFRAALSLCGKTPDASGLAAKLARQTQLDGFKDGGLDEKTVRKYLDKIKIA